MRVLLDTHIALWALTDSEKLPALARLMIEDESNDIIISAASAWEISIKHALHPERMLVSGEKFIEYCDRAGYMQLAIAQRHIVTLETLKLADDALPHKDPFDRIMVAQAKSDKLVFVTHDSLLDGYGEPCVMHV